MTQSVSHTTDTCRLSDVAQSGHGTATLNFNGMVWYGAPPTPWTAIVATRWWQLDRAPAEHAQTESLPSALVR
jgi:hypothetical protein